MSEQSKARFALDLDDLENQLRQTASAQPRAAASDPLAELARIVGQDDPFKAMFADRRSAPVAANQSTPIAPGIGYGSVSASVPGTPTYQAPRRVEPGFDRIQREPPQPAPSVQRAADADVMPARAPAPSGPPQDMLDEFDRLLQSELRGSMSAAPTVPSPVVPAPMPESASYSSAPQADGRAGSIPEDLDARAADFRAFERIPADAPDASMRATARREEALFDDYPEPPADQQADLRSLEPQQPRKGLVIAVALLGVAALGIGGIIGVRGLSGPVRSGEPPLIKAEAGPSKVQPVNPGGVEIPNQNKQIYERSPELKPGETRVVNREEQPMDVQASARAAARVILPGPGAPAEAAAPAVSPAPAPALAPTPSVAAAPAPEAPPQIAAAPPVPPVAVPPALGEPRRVRTIAVRPDGTIAPTGAQASAAPAATAAPPASTGTTATPPLRPTAAIRPPAEPQAQAAARPVAPVAPPARPAQVASAPPAAAEGAALPAGSFMIQLGAPGSESEARALFASLQRRFGSQLAGDSPTVRRAEINGGRTVYRLRVGPYSREAAAEKCQALQAAGGQCFIARN